MSNSENLEYFVKEMANSLNTYRYYICIISG